MNKKIYYGLKGTSAWSYVIAREILNDSKARTDATVQGLVVVPTLPLAEELLGNLNFFLNNDEHGVPTQAGVPGLQICISHYCPPEVLPFDALQIPPAVSAERIRAQYLLASNQPTIVVTTPEALMQRVVPKKVFRSRIAEIEQGMVLNRSDFCLFLIDLGYRKTSVVEETGQFAVRGAVIDLFSPGMNRPLRIELDGENDGENYLVLSIRHFDIPTQRSLSELEIKSAQILPSSESFTPGLSSMIRKEFLPNEELEIDEAIAVIKARASELSIPQARIKPLEESIREGIYYSGIEQLNAFFLKNSAGLWNYLRSDAKLFLIDAEAINKVATDFSAVISERAHEAENDGRLFPEPRLAYFASEELNSSLLEIATHELSSSFAEDIATDAESPVRLQERLITQLKAVRHKTELENNSPLKPLIDELKSSLRKGVFTSVVVATEARQEKMKELLGGHEVKASIEKDSSLFSVEWRDRFEQSVVILHGSLSQGIDVPVDGIQLISENDIFPDQTHRKARPSAKQNLRKILGAVNQLKEDDYIVHTDYGIGIYRGLKEIKIEQKTGDFLELEYAEGSKLFIPVENIGKVQKYASAEGRPPTLTRLGGNIWEAQKKKVQANVEELAGQLLHVMAERELAIGHSFGTANEDDREFAETFPYEETADQAAAIKAVLSDMESERPMDRLVCGDVGFGKTEVAIRAVFKAANSGKQTAILVPTTVLAEQHFKTFTERFSGTAVRIACVSRFYSAAENKETLDKVARGTCDVIIGTHRLLQNDVVFNDLGLVVIDEEHRFGVAHKEKLKRFRAAVDILTLTATPIPRTLHQSLSGLRELSLIETAPSSREVIRTYIANYSDSVVREAILREIGRSGQVFYINNRVQNIYLVKDELQKLIPEARFGVGHGQMKEHELEDVMHKFIGRELDVLVCTTIVESGIDIPNANTIVIRDADHFGLAELYQLRGRVGRASRRAYAYLLVSDTRNLGADAKKRLEVLRSLDDLGVGFRLALQDMEIRGAGNILGKNQSGHIDLVGFELYSRILKEAVDELKKVQKRSAGNVEHLKPSVPEIYPDISIGFPAHIPSWYIPDIQERLIIYQRLIELNSEQDTKQIAEEIEDRFGKFPEDVQMLIELMDFRRVLRKCGIINATYRKGILSIKFHPLVEIDLMHLTNCVRKSAGRLKISPLGVLSIQVTEEVNTPLVLGSNLVSVLEELQLSQFLRQA